MDKHFIGYLRDTLDPATRRSVEAYLRTHPDAAARLGLLRRLLGPWD
jgi:anti-sigma factor RsiW